VSGIVELHGNLSVDARGELYVCGAFHVADGAELAVHGALAVENDGNLVLGTVPRSSRLVFQSERLGRRSAYHQSARVPWPSSTFASAASGLITVFGHLALGASAELDGFLDSEGVIVVGNEGMSGSCGSSIGISNADSVTAQRGGTGGGARFADLTQTGNAALLWWFAPAPWPPSGALRSSGRAQVLVMSGARLIQAQDSVSSIDGDAPSMIALGGLEVGEDAALTVADVQILSSGEWDVLGRLTLTGSRVMLRPSRRELLQAVPQHLWGDFGQAADGDVGGLSVAQGGRLEGYGTVDGDLANAGIVAPAISTQPSERLVVTGNYVSSGTSAAARTQSSKFSSGALTLPAAWPRHRASSNSSTTWRYAGSARLVGGG
jgi:hypothetical protein